MLLKAKYNKQGICIYVQHKSALKKEKYYCQKNYYYFLINRCGF